MLKPYDEMTEDEKRIFDQAMDICDQMHEQRKHDRFNPDETTTEKILRQQFLAGCI